MLVLNITRELARRLRVADGMIAGFLATAWDSNLGYGGKARSEWGG
jgi:hypothetical protein